MIRRLFGRAIVFVIFFGCAVAGQDAIAGFSFLAVNDQGYPEYTHEETGIVFVRLPGGWFTMGSAPDEIGHNIPEPEEGPRHTVMLSPFLIAKYEVSQREWEAVMGEWDTYFDGDNLPVEQVSWNDIQGFEAATGLTLPTEAQWEYACRAGTTTPFALGDGECLSTDHANYYGPHAHCEGQCRKGIDRRTTVPVESFTPNRFGLHNMHGNVYAWCEDSYQSDFYAECEGAVDPLCGNPDSGARVVRGGAWYNWAVYCRSAYRAGYDPSLRLDSIGFRPAAPSP